MHNVHCSQWLIPHKTNTIYIVLYIKINFLIFFQVISTDSEEDCYACFSGIKDKVNEQKVCTHSVVYPNLAITVDC